MFVNESFISIRSRVRLSSLKRHALCERARVSLDRRHVLRVTLDVRSPMEQPMRLDVRLMVSNVSGPRHLQRQEVDVLVVVGHRNSPFLHTVRTIMPEPRTTVCAP